MTINSSVGVLQRREARAKMSCPWLFVQRLGLWSGLCLRWARTLQQSPGSAVAGKVWHALPCHRAHPKQCWPKAGTAYAVLRYPNEGYSGEQSSPDKFQSLLTFLWCQTLKITAGVEGQVTLGSKHTTLSYFSILAWTIALQKPESLGFPTPHPKKWRRESEDLKGNKLNLRACKMNSLTRRVLPHPRNGVTAWKHALFLSSVIC